MKLSSSATATAVLMAAALPALASEATFERNLSVNGRVELTVNTGSGNIHITRGSDNQIHIFGKVHSNNWNGDNEAACREIAANPPIEQTGNIVRIGKHTTRAGTTSASITKFRRPAYAFLYAGSGSGDVKDGGCRRQCQTFHRLRQHSRHRLHGSFSVSTGSGDIVC